MLLRRPSPSLDLPKLLLLVAFAILAFGRGPAAEATDGAVERWYEQRLRGAKAGHLHVVWSPGTRDGEPTVRDRTTIVAVSTRSMGGIRDRFETTTEIELERAPDGRLWSQQIRVEEGGRATVESIHWTGRGYRSEARLGDSVEVVEIAAEAPVTTDSESFLGGPIRRGELAVGTTLRWTALDVRARKTETVEVEVLAREDVTIEGLGAIACWKIAERHLASRAESLLWIDGDGGLVRYVGEGGTEILKATRETAETMPARPAEYGITVAARPRLERVFGADRLFVTLRLQPDPTRRLPELPASPWSKAHPPEGDEQSGWRIDVDLARHAGTGLSASFPLALGEHAAEFATDLEATVLMPVGHERLTTLAKEIVGDAKDARLAAHRLARWVYRELAKQSPDVAQASALEILDHRCGDCSEHALLFVALCRAAGIPARRCSGYVCVGSLWGSHAWAEIWVGEWVAADPTTGEIAPGARYVFFGYPDRAGSWPGLVSSRIQGRLAIETRRLDEGASSYRFGDPSSYRVSDPATRRYVHVLAGIEAVDVPAAWRVTLSGDAQMSIRAPTFHASIRAFATQGTDFEELRDQGDEDAVTTFAGIPALRAEYGARWVYTLVSRGRVIQINVQDRSAPADDDEEGDGGAGVAARVAAHVAELERRLAPTFATP